MRRSVALRRILCKRASSSMSMSFSFCTFSSPVIISTTPAAEPTSIGMGNVTKQNFWGSLEAFKAQIASADFVAVDLELTGIHSVPPSLPFHHSLTSLPNPLQRSYHRLKHLAEKFAVVQVGVALFELHENLNKYLVHPYNFYVFPRSELPLDLPGATFSCEAAALEFLASHGFDFNLCIQEGVSYLSKTQEDEAQLQLNQHVAFKDSSCACSRNSTSTSDFVFCERFRMELEKWTNKIKINNVNNNVKNILHMHMVKEASTFRIRDEPNLACYTTPQRDALSKYPNFTAELDNHHQVCLARGVVDRHFENLFPIVMSNCGSPPGNHKISIIFTNTRNELENLKKEWTQGSEESKIKAAVGFRHIIDAIVSSRKPLIGHNCALDLAHIHHKFISSLPMTMEEFSSSLLSNFPFIIDTKYLIKSEPSLRTSWARRHTSLNAVYSHFSKPKDIKYGAARYARSLNHLSHRASIEIIAGFKRYQDSDHTLLHEAGYDAFMTGSVFAQVCHQLHVNVKHLHSSNTSAITDYVNLLNLGSGILDLSTGKQKAKGNESSCYYNPSFASNIM